MPPKLTDGEWLETNLESGKLLIGTADGGIAPFDSVKTIMLDEAPEYDFTPPELCRDYTFRATIRLPHKAQIAFARSMREVIKLLRRYNNVARRLIRTEKRQAEIERRRRLKDDRLSP